MPTVLENDYSLPSRTFVLKVTCPGARGIVAAIGSFLAERRCNIREMSQYDALEEECYFSRVVFDIEPPEVLTTRDLQEAFRETATRFQMQWELRPVDEQMRVLLMVSKFDHCVADLLYRVRMGELPMQVTGIVSNHELLRPLAERHGVPYHVLPVTSATKADQEESLQHIIEQTRSELIVLARYMQVLSDSLCSRMPGRIINIHHSFLPSFKGAKPYHQAFKRGVKLIGATAHYVTADLDEGPIIEQVVQRIDHGYGPEQLVAAGRDSEALALARAVKYHIESRVFLNGSKTIVFR